MGIWFLCKICAIIQEKWVFLWLWKVLFLDSMGQNLLGKIIKSGKDHFKDPFLTSEKKCNFENMKVRIGLIWQCVLYKYHSSSQRWLSMYAIVMVKYGKQDISPLQAINQNITHILKAQTDLCTCGMSRDTWTPNQVPHLARHRVQKSVQSHRLKCKVQYFIG